MQTNDGLIRFLIMVLLKVSACFIYVTCHSILIYCLGSLFNFISSFISNYPLISNAEGKTMLMDMFYSATEGIVKHRRRYHFHEVGLLLCIWALPDTCGRINIDIINVVFWNIFNIYLLSET